MNASQNSVHIFDEKLWPPPRVAHTSHPLQHSYLNKVERNNHKTNRQVLFRFYFGYN